MANAALLLATLAGVGCGLGGDVGLATDGSGDTGGETGTALEIPDAPPGPDCSARDCGAAGRCVVVGDRALCRCDQGHAADESSGGPCTACPPANDDPIVRDLVPVSVAGEITVDGVSLLGDTVNQGLIELVGEQEGDRIPLGSVQSASYDARVLPGTYALDFAFGT